MVSGDGKAASTAEAEQFATSGTVVLSIDMRGTGETRVDTDMNSRESDHYFGDFSDIMTALLVGKTMAGMRALDVARGIDLLLSRNEVDPNQVYGYGKDEGGLPLLYASVLDSRIRRVVLAGMLVSYELVVNSRVHRHVLEGVAPGMLKSYDLQDLVAALAPRDVWIVSGKDPLGHELPASEVRKEYQRALEAFRHEGAGQAIHIMDRARDQDVTAPLP